jgi:hypothetical protein
MTGSRTMAHCGGLLHDPVLYQYRAKSRAADYTFTGLLGRPHR